MARPAGGAVLRLRWGLGALAAVAPHPGLWLTALRQLHRLAPTRWWARPPFLPLPAPGYLRFRLETAYGGTGDHPVVAADLVTYLRWCRRFPSATG